MKKLDIIYEDKDILVINKPPKLLTISDGKTDNTLYSMASSYVKKQHKSNKIFIVHRLDKDTSGIIIFAKNLKVKNYLQTNWLSTTRQYIGILEGKLLKPKGIIKQYLKESITHQVYVSKTGDYAETHYQVLNYTNNFTVVKINIKTGKKHQIRVAFSNLGYPLIGDKKYHSKTDPIKRLGLHANYLKVKLNNKDYEFKSKIPKEFLNFYKEDKNA